MLEEQQVNVVKKEELNKSIIHNINAAVIFLNHADKIEIFNPCAEQMFVQSFANAKNNVLERVLSDFPEMVEFVQQNKGLRRSAEVTSSGRVCQIDLSPLGEIGTLIMIRDLTEEKMREEIDRRNKNFITLGEMTAFLTHEVRNSLGVIYGYMKTLKADSKKTQRINKEIQFLNAMIESFLNFSKPVRVEKREKVDLINILTKTCSEYKIGFTPPTEKMVLETDPALVRSLFSNMVLNAREAGADLIEIGVEKEDFFELTLRDNGNGMDEKTKEKMWLPFFSTKEKGTGMGLAIVRKIVNSLNGEISLVESNKEGTTFKITFYN
jgi:two-component system sensor histidine kinase PilS (NtrC family)